MLTGGRYGGGQLLLRDNLAPRGIKREAQLFPTCYGLVTSVITQSVMIVSLIYFVAAVMLGKIPVGGCGCLHWMSHSRAVSLYTGAVPSVFGLDLFYDREPRIVD